MIVDMEVPAEIIDENSSAIAVLEINPISKGHLMIIPKKPASTSKELPTQAFTLAKKLSKKIISKLKASSTEIQTEFKFNETIINVIPVYDKPLNINSPRYKASKDELESLASKLKIRKKPKIIRIKASKPDSQTPVLKWHRKIP
jgi:histidine triad (HIT) family protein